MSISENIKHYQPILLTETKPCFAVLILLINYPDKNPDILLMQRPTHFSSYPGDICFPGGKKEATDSDLKMTALRETYEEIGLMLNEEEILGSLNDFHDRYQNLVRPFIAMIDDKALKKNPLICSEEVDGLIYLPLSNIQNFMLDVTNIKVTRRKPNYILSVANNFIWGLTASILVHLSNIIYNQHKPVGFVS